MIHVNSNMKIIRDVDDSNIIDCIRRVEKNDEMKPTRGNHA